MAKWDELDSDADPYRAQQTNLTAEAMLRLVELLKANEHRGLTKLGTLRNLLSVGDTSAYPPQVLSTPVYSDSSMGSSNALGTFDPGIRQIKMYPWAQGHHYTAQKYPHAYTTLLHEGAHARGFSQDLAYNTPHWSFGLADIRGTKQAKQLEEEAAKLRTEKYAYDFADSLMRARGF